MQKDAYSLGICLFEIGLWATFVEWYGEDGETSVKSPSKIRGLEVDDFDQKVPDAKAS